MPACPSCPSLFPNTKYLNQHRKTVHGSKCPDCEQVFVDKASVAQHHSIKHREGDSYRCVWCSTLFSDVRVLDAHIASTYTTRALNVAAAEGVATLSENRTPEGAPPNGLVALPWVADPVRGREPTADKASGLDETRSASSPHLDGTIHTSSVDEECFLTRTPSIAESDEVWTDANSGSIGNADKNEEDALREDQAGPEFVLAAGAGDIADSKQSSRAASVAGDSAVSDATAPATTRDATPPSTPATTRDATPPSTPGPIPVRNQTSATASRSTSEELRASPADFACKICSRMPADPTVTVCGHLFCHSCIMVELAKRLCCPTCQTIMFIRIMV